MKAILLLLLALFSLQSFAKDIAIQCEIIETPTSTHNSWAITILNEKVAFFDNSEFSYARLSTKVLTDGGSEYLVFKSNNKDDPFRINLDHPSALENHEIIYAELYLGRSHRPDIFECKKTTVAEAKEYLSEYEE